LKNVAAIPAITGVFAKCGEQTGFRGGGHFAAFQTSGQRGQACCQAALPFELRGAARAGGKVLRRARGQRLRFGRLRLQGHVPEQRFHFSTRHDIHAGHLFGAVLPGTRERSCLPSSWPSSFCANITRARWSRERIVPTEQPAAAAASA
jgi:hypothetical protein